MNKVRFAVGDADAGLRERLDEEINAFNATATGSHDGRMLSVAVRGDDGDLHAAGYRLGVSDLVEARAQQAQVLGVDGLVCSAEEAASLHRIVGHRMVLVTPGIRPAGAAVGDQKRIMTPGRAIAAGADYLVVGRPVLEAADPKAAADAMRAEILQALGK